MFVRLSTGTHFFFRRRYNVHSGHLKEYQKGLQKADTVGSALQKGKPITFEQQIVRLNSPQMVKYMEVVEYGIKLPDTKTRKTWLLFLALLFISWHEQMLPTPIVERYLSVSQQIQENWVGYIGASLTMNGFTLLKYLPMLLIVNHSTRYIKWYAPLIILNMAVDGIVAHRVAEKKLEKLEVWDRVKIQYGQGILHSISFCLWSHMGLNNGLGEAYRSRLFLRSKAGLGILNHGIPIGYVLIGYLLYELYRSYNLGISGAPTELIISSIAVGIVYGRLLRRLKL